MTATFATHRGQKCNESTTGRSSKQMKTIEFHKNIFFKKPRGENEKKVWHKEEVGPPLHHIKCFHMRRCAGLFCCFHRKQRRTRWGCDSRSLVRHISFLQLRPLCSNRSDIQGRKEAVARRSSLVARRWRPVGAAQQQERRSEMKLLGVFATLVCFFANAADSDSSCDGELCHTALTRSWPPCFQRWKWLFSFSWEKKVVFVYLT